MKIINPFKSHKKKDFIAYWDLKQFSQLLNKGIEVGSNYFFLIKNVGVFLFVRESDFKGTRVFEREDKELLIFAEGFDEDKLLELENEEEEQEFKRLCFESGKLYGGDICEWFHLSKELASQVKQKIKEGYTKLKITIKPLEFDKENLDNTFIETFKDKVISHIEPIKKGGSCPESPFKANINLSYSKSSNSSDLNNEYEGKPLFINSSLAKEIIVNNQILEAELKYVDLCTKGEDEENQENYEQAIIYFSQALEIFEICPLSAVALFRRARLFRVTGEYEKAIKDYDEYIKLQPDEFRGYINRGIVNLEKKDFENSLIDLSKGLEINPNDHIGYSFMADLKKELGNLEEAILSMEKAIEIDPKNGFYFLKKGKIYIDLDNYEKAEKDLTKAIKLGENDPAIYYLRGMSRRLTENSKGACKDWKKAAELGDKDSEELFNKYCS